MIALGLRGLARLVAAVVLLVLAIGCGAAAIGAATGRDGLTNIASALQADDGRQQADEGLARLEAPGPTAEQGAIVGGAMLLGGLLVAAGCVVPARKRLVRLGAEGDDARITARPKALAGAARALAEDVPGVAGARTSVRGRRRRPGGRLRVRARSTPGADPEAVAGALAERLDPLADGLGVRGRTSVARPPRARESAPPRRRVA